MKLKTKKIILNVSFVIILLLTIAAFVVELKLSIPKSEETDDIFGSSMNTFITLLFMIPIVIAESDIFYSVRYFLRPKPNKVKDKSIINGASCVLSTFTIVGFLFSLIATYSSNAIIDMYSFGKFLMIWVLCWFLIRIMYCINCIVGKSENRN